MHFAQKHFFKYFLLIPGVMGCGPLNSEASTARGQNRGCSYDVHNEIFYSKPSLKCSFRIWQIQLKIHFKIRHILVEATLCKYLCTIFSNGHALLMPWIFGKGKMGFFLKRSYPHLRHTFNLGTLAWANLLKRRLRVPSNTKSWEIEWDIYTKHYIRDIIFSSTNGIGSFSSKGPSIHTLAVYSVYI